MKYLIFLCIPFLFACESKEDILYKQYVEGGRVLYNTNCSNCHQEDGKGLRDLYPALANTNFLTRIPANDLICMMKYGKKGTQGYMPGNSKLEAIDMAELVTYMRNTWGEKKEIYSFDEAKAALKLCKP